MEGDFPILSASRFLSGALRTCSRKRWIVEAEVVESKPGEILQVTSVIEYGIPESRLDILYGQELMD